MLMLNNKMPFLFSMLVSTTSFLAYFLAGVLVYSAVYKEWDKWKPKKWAWKIGVLNLFLFAAMTLFMVLGQLSDMRSIFDLVEILEEFLGLMLTFIFFYSALSKNWGIWKKGGVLYKTLISAFLILVLRSFIHIFRYGKWATMPEILSYFIEELFYNGAYLAFYLFLYSLFRKNWNMWKKGGVARYVAYVVIFLISLNILLHFLFEV